MCQSLVFFPVCLFAVLTIGSRMLCTDHRCTSRSFIHASLLAKVVSSLTPSLGSLRLCRFAFECSFWVSFERLHTFFILSLTVSILLSPFPAHLWKLHFWDTVHHSPSSHTSGLLFSGHFRFLKENNTAQYPVLQSNRNQAAQFSVSLYFWTFSPVGRYWRRAI